MKALQYLSLSLVLISRLASAESAGSGSHGGDIQRSKPAQVNAAVSQIKAQLDTFLTGLPNTVLPVLPEGRLKVMLATMLKDRALFDDIQDSKYVPEPSAPCLDDEKRKWDAGTPKKRGANVCFSVPRITRVSPSALMFELIPLAMHEHAHHFGYNEDDAQLIQNFFQNEYREAWARQTFREGLAITARQAQYTAEELGKKISSGSQDPELCVYIEKLSSQANLLFETSNQFPYRFPPTTSNSDRWNAPSFTAFKHLVDSALGYCGINRENSGFALQIWPSEYLKPQDQDLLSKKVTEIREALEKLYNLL